MNFFIKLKQFFIDRTESVSSIEKKINYIFHNKDYIRQAFTHKSLDTSPRKNYERLEFLGDAVLDIIVSRELMREFPEGDEGLLTQRRASLVQKPFLATIGHLLDLMDHLKIEHSVNLNIEKIADKQLANLFEALIGAMYLDGGIEPCRRLILDTIWAHKEEAWKSTNYKGKLIEYCHSHEIENPVFLVKDISGPDHQKTFEIQVKIGSKTYASGLGTNKKTAEQTAAQLALEELGAVF
ncbi:MAG: ribonuclease III [Candidatus Neomarinimicrobiota bacterium]|nr:ribonuclease III [Candidatus Neomarinimicrobiota bacterium]MEE3153155.1 ribonuclease III [Candidatus Neomarinimicrobiota bacterium]